MPRRLSRRVSGSFVHPPDRRTARLIDRGRPAARSPASPPSAPSFAGMCTSRSRNWGGIRKTCAHFSSSAPATECACQHRGMQPDNVPPLPPIMYRQALLSSGITEDEIRWARGNGTWTRLHRGTYCESEPTASLTKEGMYRLRATAVAGSISAPRSQPRIGGGGAPIAPVRRATRHGSPDQNRNERRPDGSGARGACRGVGSRRSPETTGFPGHERSPDTARPRLHRIVRLGGGRGRQCALPNTCHPGGVGGGTRPDPASPWRSGRASGTVVRQWSQREPRGDSAAGGHASCRTSGSRTADLGLRAGRHLPRSGRPRISGTRPAYRVRREDEIHQAPASLGSRSRRWSWPRRNARI